MCSEPFLCPSTLEKQQHNTQAGVAVLGYLAPSQSTAVVKCCIGILLSDNPGVPGWEGKEEYKRETHLWISY